MEQLNAAQFLRKIIREIEKKMHKNPSVLAEQLLTPDEQAAFTNDSPEESQAVIPGVGVGAIYFQNSDRQDNGTVAALQKELVSLRESFNKYRLETGKTVKKLSEQIVYQQETLERQQSGIGKLFKSAKQFKSARDFIIVVIMAIIFFGVTKYNEIEEKCSAHFQISTEDTIDKGTII